MLINFSVTGFRNFEHELNFDFRNVTDYDFNQECIKNNVVNTAIIYGQNGSGKSNLGLAIIDIKNVLYNKRTSAQERNLFLNGNVENEIVQFKYDFEFNGNKISLDYNKDKKAQLLYEVLVINDEIIYKYNHIDNEMTFENLAIIGAETLNFSSLKENLADTQISILNYIFNNSTANQIMFEFFDYISNMHFMNAIAPTNDRIYEYIIEQDYIEDFNEFLRSFSINDEVLVAFTVTGEKILAINYKNKNIPFIESASSGTQALAKFYYWYKNTDKISFLYLDEFDAYYHYEISRNLIDRLKSIDNLQVIFTTHNTNLLNNRILRPDCYFVLGKNKLTPLHKATSRELKQGHNLEKLYLGGDFNA